MKGVIKEKRRLNKAGDFEYLPEYYVDGVQVTERKFLDLFPDKEGCPGGHSSAGWPMTSEALAVHPCQVKAAHEKAARLGVPTEFKETGEPVFRDPGHRRKFCQAHQAFDRNGGYSDPQP